MNRPDFSDVLGPALSGALEKKGFANLTSVQEAILDPKLAGRDLRITSQTGSGKTVGIGFALRALLATDCAAKAGIARPVALVVAPTRELAKQVEEELRWLYTALGVKIASTTGGAHYGSERRALAVGPAVIVGTPGRLLDHLERGAIDAGQVGAIVLDEADRMLDLGFRDELESILAYAPAGHRTHLVSATFPREVRALADRVQKDPAHVEGTPLGAANLDIDHVLHVVDHGQRVDAIVNLLLANPDEQTLVFARTRADVAQIASELSQAGFAVGSLSGEMEQPERNRAMGAFKRGHLRALVATDVAARGIDVQDIGRVIHADPPGDPDAYTHRSGRTGRAGRKGTSSVLMPPAAMTKVTLLLKRAKVTYRIEPIPTADAIRRAGDERAYEELTKADPEGFPGFDARTWALAQRLAKSDDVARILARLLAKTKLAATAEPRDVRPVTPRADVKRRPGTARDGEPRGERPHVRAAAEPRGERPDARRGRGGPWIPFRVSWGGEDGADARRVLALVCRRGGIRGSDVGAIKVVRRYSVVEVNAAMAEAFAEAAQAPDPRDPRVTIRRELPASTAPKGPPRGRAHHPSAKDRPRPSTDHRKSSWRAGR
jgi:ATP-dependent RNA helicase DeaD